MNYYGDDGYDLYGYPVNRRPSPHHTHSARTNYLDPLSFGGQGLHRSRSQGHGPTPQVNIRMYQGNENRSPSPIPIPFPAPYPPSSSSRRASPRSSSQGRGRSPGVADHLTAQLNAELADMALEHRYSSRSRGRSDATGYDRPRAQLAEWQLAQKEQQLRDLSRERKWKLEEESIRRRIKLEQIEQERKDQERADRERRLVEEAQRKAQLDREKKETAELTAVREWERKQEEARRSKEAAEAAAVREWERKQAEAKKKAKDAEDALKAKMAREAREAKEEEKRVLEEYKRKEKERAEEEARLEAEYERKRLEKEAKKKKDKEEEEQAFQEEMRKRLRALGYTEQTIEIMVNEEKAKQFKKEVESRSRSRENRPKVAVAPWEPPTRAPVYPKIHKKFLDVKTLEYYQLPWHYDVGDPDYIIIMRDMDKRATDVLFEHTTRLRKGALLLEPAKEKKQFAMYRRRSKSRTGVKEIGVVRLA